MKYKTLLIKAVEEDSGGGSIVAYASTFDREPDSYGDVIAPGAFAGTLERWKESGNTIPLLYGHDFSDPYKNIGGITLAEEDERGLKIEATFDADNETAQQCRRLVLKKRLMKLSFAYDVLNSGEVTLDDGRKANELRELEIYEVSLVPIPANPHTEVIEAKGAKVGRTISKATNEKLQEAYDALAAMAEAIEGFKTTISTVMDDIADLLGLNPADPGTELPEPDGLEADDEPVDGEETDPEPDDGESNAEDPDEGNAEDEKSAAELVKRIDTLLKGNE